MFDVWVYNGGGGAPLVKTQWPHKPAAGDRVRVDKSNRSIESVVLVDFDTGIGGRVIYYEVRLGLS